MDTIKEQSLKAAEKTLEETLTFKRKVGIITLCITIFSTLSFLSTYSFLFGYYFGGEVNNSFSNFEIFRRLVPFHINTMTYTYFMLSLSITSIIYSIKFLREKDLTFKFLAVVCLLIFHVFMTAFFSKEININNLLYFAAIWVIPLFLGLMILYIIQGTRDPFKTFSGTFFGFATIFIIMFFYGDLPEEWGIIVLNLAIFSFGFIFSKIPFKRYYNFIFIFPYVFLGVLLLIGLFPDVYKGQTDLSKAIIILIVPTLISVVLSILIRGKLKEKDKPEDFLEEESTLNRLIIKLVIVFFSPKSNKGVLAFLVIILLGAYVMTPRVSTATAKIIRSFTPKSEFQFDLIKIKDLKEKPIIIKGIIVAEQDGVIYISNENWELEQIKTDKYFVERVKNDK